MLIKYIVMLQKICIVSVCLGIAIEIHYGADLGYILITAGTIAFGLSEKLHTNLHKKGR